MDVCCDVHCYLLLLNQGRKNCCCCRPFVVIMGATATAVTPGGLLPSPPAVREQQRHHHGGLYPRLSLCPIRYRLYEARSGLVVVLRLLDRSAILKREENNETETAQTRMSEGNVVLENTASQRGWKSPSLACFFARLMICVPPRAFFASCSTSAAVLSDAATVCTTTFLNTDPAGQGVAQKTC